MRDRNSDRGPKGPPDLSAAVFVHTIAGRESFPGADGSGESPERAKKIFKAVLDRYEREMVERAIQRARSQHTT